MEQVYISPTIYYQYHACWSPGDLRSQGISRHGIDQLNQNIPSLASEELIWYIVNTIAADDLATWHMTLVKQHFHFPHFKSS